MEEVEFEIRDLFEEVDEGFSQDRSSIVLKVSKAPLSSKVLCSGGDLGFLLVSDRDSKETSFYLRCSLPDQYLLFVFSFSESPIPVSAFSSSIPPLQSSKPFY